MNTKRIIFWSSFIIILGLIIWGLIAANNKSPDLINKVGVPAPVTSADYVRGDFDAPITLLTYEDFQCPACQVYYYHIERLFNEASSTMRLVFRHFPLSQHPNAVPAARASEAAASQGKFWEMYSELYVNQTDWAEKSLAETKTIFEGYATKIGLNIAQYRVDEASATTSAKIEAQQQEGISIAIDHTPSFFLNGKEINPNNYEEFKTIIDATASTTTQ